MRIKTRKARLLLHERRLSHRRDGKRIKDRPAAGLRDVRPKPEPNPAAPREVFAGRTAGGERVEVGTVEFKARGSLHRHEQHRNLRSQNGAHGRRIFDQVRI